MAFITGIILGLVDAATSSWIAKAYVWAVVLGFYAMLVAYEFIVMPTPPRPLLQAFLFIIAAPMGILTGHHLIWLAARAMLSGMPANHLWLTLNTYTSLNMYLTLTGAMLTIYTIIMIISNLKSCD
ncbi:MAG: hypothetical protein RXO54_07330 [Acidilobus sp.]|jgi:hypothetical protein